MEIGTAWIGIERRQHMGNVRIFQVTDPKEGIIFTSAEAQFFIDQVKAGVRENFEGAIKVGPMSEVNKDYTGYRLYGHSGITNDIIIPTEKDLAEFFAALSAWQGSFAQPSSTENPHD